MFLTFFFLLKSLYDVTLKKIYTVQFFVFKAIFSTEVLFHTDFCLFWLINYSSFLRDTLKIAAFYCFKLFYVYFIFWLIVKIQHKYSHIFSHLKIQIFILVNILVCNEKAVFSWISFPKMQIPFCNSWGSSAENSSFRYNLFFFKCI